MLRRLGIALCLTAMAACHGGMSVSRHDGAIDWAGAGPDGSLTDDAPVPDAFDLGSAGDGVPDSALVDEPREAAASDARDALDANVSEASGQDAKADAPNPLDGVPADAGLATDGPAPVADARPDVNSPDSGLAGFCTGSLARLATNGHSTGPAIHATILAMDCCEGFELEIVTATFLYGIYVRWIVPASAGAFPLDVDLSAPTSLRSFQVLTNCDSTRANCSDVYQANFVGRLQLSRTDGGYGYDASLCVHVEEPADSPHPHLHAFDLYVPHITFR